MKFKLYELKSFVGGIDSDEELEEDLDLTPKFKLLMEFNYKKLIKSQKEFFNTDMLMENEFIELFEKVGIPVS